MATHSNYKVQRDYSSSLGTFEGGTTVELEDDLAEHIERDSPGTLAPAAGKQRAEEAPPADRMWRAAPNRAFPDGPPLSRIPPPQYPLVPTEEDAKEVQAASVAGPDVAAEVIADKEAEDPDVPADTADPYEGKTVAELRDIAAERDISGRSSMNRDELVAALQGSENAD